MIFGRRLIVHAELLWQLDCVGISFAEKTSTGHFCVANAVTFASPTADDDRHRPEPAITLARDEAQALMDELWRIGIRPTDGTGSTGQLKATQEHLKDMRSLAFGSLIAKGAVKDVTP